MGGAIRRHWREYLIEAFGLGMFMVSAGVFGLLLEHPGSPARMMLPDPFVRRVLMGLAMGGTAIAIIYSPWGKRSGAHINPAVTLTFWRLGRVETPDAIFYSLAQFAGGAAGLALVALLAGRALADPAVAYVITVPGPGGTTTAFVAEAAISFGLMLVVLLTANHSRFAPYTGLLAGFLVAAYIAFEAPLSGMSMNPARSFASGVSAHQWTAHWIYFLAPPLGMLAAAELYVRWPGAAAVLCAKLNHAPGQPCPFRCGFCRH